MKKLRLVNQHVRMPFVGVGQESNVWGVVVVEGPKIVKQEASV